MGKKTYKQTLVIAASVFILLVCSLALVINQSTVANIFTNVINFLETVELKTFDARQRINASSRETSDDVVILAIDERTYSALTERFGEWPIPRDVYADIINYIERDSPKAICLDLLFISSIKSSLESDKYLSKTIAKYENVFTSMNFDFETAETRLPIDLPSGLKVNIKNYSKIEPQKNININFPNCRKILPEILNSTKNIGLINATPSIDGIYREFSPFFVYKNEYYPNLSTKLLMQLEEQKTKKKIDELIINSNNQLEIGEYKIPLQKNATSILHWYDRNNSFAQVSFLDVYKSMKGEKTLNKIPKNYFKDKIIYVGTSAVALYDIKSSPITSVMPAVNLHTTFVNNALDNSFIVRLNPLADFLITFTLSVLLIFFLFRIKRPTICFLVTILLTVGYILFSGWIMKVYDIWIPIILPVISLLLTFTAVYVVKYLLKSRDLEYTYKLATTDGLTELYNHRYFQEQLIINIENSKRYGTSFSLLLIDIDFFKKFNDKYGHQAGDNVLKQVSQILKKTVRVSDIVCRYGGEEMTIILPNTAKQEAVLTAQKICNIVANTPFKLGQNNIQTVTISLGVSTYPENGVSSTDIIGYADKGLYKAKENGRNQVGLADDVSAN